MPCRAVCGVAALVDSRAIHYVPRLASHPGRVLVRLQKDLEQALKGISHHQHAQRLGIPGCLRVPCGKPQRDAVALDALCPGFQTTCQVHRLFRWVGWPRPHFLCHSRRWLRREGGFGCSSMVLYINSSSSRASHFCGQGQFVQCWRGVAQLQSLCGGLHKGRGSETTTSGHRLFVWITVQLCQNCSQCYPQRVPVGKLFHPTKHKARGPWRTPGFVRQEEREPPPTLEPPPASGRPHEGIYFAGAACGC